MQTIADKERIDLLRCGFVVSSFAGAFGSALRETRLTAMLGYLIALVEPERFCNIFAFRGRPLSVGLETRHRSERSDILIDTTEGRGVPLPLKDLVKVKYYKVNFAISDKYPVK